MGQQQLSPENGAKAILALKGQPTNNLQMTLDKAVELGDRAFPTDTVINIGINNSWNGFDSASNYS